MNEYYKGVMIRVLVFLVFLSVSFEAFSLPFSPECKTQVEYSYYSLCYSPHHMQPLWTVHFLTKKSIKGKQKRTNDFRADNSLDNAVQKNDYKKSGFDRGHLVPAGDMKLNYTSMSETFLMTNISPQKSGFNSGIWRVVEEKIRALILEFEDAWIITAPVLKKNTAYNRIKAGVSIPDLFYKIVYFPKSKYMVAFLVPNASQNRTPVTKFQVAVDDIEELTGLDYFSELPDDLEESLESVGSN